MSYKEDVVRLLKQFKVKDGVVFNLNHVIEIENRYSSNIEKNKHNRLYKLLIGDDSVYIHYYNTFENDNYKYRETLDITYLHLDVLKGRNEYKPCQYKIIKYHRGNNITTREYKYYHNIDKNKNFYNDSFRPCKIIEEKGSYIRKQDYNNLITEFYNEKKFTYSEFEEDIYKDYNILYTTYANRNGEICDDNEFKLLKRKHILKNVK